jgi:hypothetical protein
MNVLSFLRAVFLNLSIGISAIVLFACSDAETEVPEPIIHRMDGRTVKLSDPSGIALDVNENGIIDFNIFIELTANDQGDRLYAGINPIGANAILAGPADDDNFLSMGFAKALTPPAMIPDIPAGDLQWSPDFHSLAIRNTSTSGTLSYEGDWSNNAPAFLPIRLDQAGKKNYGWLKLHFDKETEVLTLEEYAFHPVEGVSLSVGEL